MESPDESDTEQKADKGSKTCENLSFVKLLEEFPVICNKSQVPAIRNEKVKAREEIAKRWTKLTAKSITAGAILKKFNNLKSRTIVKSNANKTGNKKIVLEEWEGRLLKLLGADSNPVLKNIPGGIEVGFKNTVSASKVDVAEKSTESQAKPPPILNKKPLEKGILEAYETAETSSLSNQQLQRLLLLEQLKLIRLKMKRLQETEAIPNKKSRKSSSSEDNGCDY